MTSIYDFHAESLDGKDVALSDYRGSAMLIVNTASKCGLTPQYEGLEALFEKYRALGLVILGFPCNQFGKQEPGDASEIGAFCTKNYGVSFPMFAKIDVNGSNASRLYKFLKHEKPGIFGTESIKWNFTKFLIDRKGNVVKRFAPATKPQDLVKPIEALLN